AWSSHAVALLDEVSREVPIRIDLERDPNPAMDADIGRHEVAARIGLHQCVLCAGWSLAPDRPSARVAIVAHGEDLVAHSKRGIADAAALGRLRERQADPAQALQQRLLIGHSPSLRRASAGLAGRPRWQASRACLAGGLRHLSATIAGDADQWAAPD